MKRPGEALNPIPLCVWGRHPAFVCVWRGFKVIGRSKGFTPFLQKEGHYIIRCCLPPRSSNTQLLAKLSSGTSFGGVFFVWWNVKTSGRPRKIHCWNFEFGYESGAICTLSVLILFSRKGRRHHKFFKGPSYTCLL